MGVKEKRFVEDLKDTFRTIRFYMVAKDVHVQGDRAYAFRTVITPYRRK